MNAPHQVIRDIKLVNDGGQKSVAVEFGDGRVRTFTGKDLYEASKFVGQAPTDTGSRTAAQRRAEEMLSSRRRR
jgi:hypothetical protein